MGFFDKLKKKAQDTMNQVQGAQHSAPPAAPGQPQEQHQAQGYSQPAAAAPVSHGHAAAVSGPSFSYDGDNYPIPPGWDGLSMDDWFFRFVQIQDHLMRADEEDLPSMQDEDGDDLDAEEVLLRTQYGYTSMGQWEAYRNHMVMRWASQTGESFTDCEFRMTTIARERLMGNKAQAMSGAGGALEPVEGVSLQQWAAMQAAVAGGADAGAVCAQQGIDRPRWDRVSAEWNARMSTDTTATIATAYGNAFAGAAQGQFGSHAAQAAAVGAGGNVGAEPIPFERFVEIQEAMGAAADRGQDATAVLGQFGMSPMDWGGCGMYWNKKMAQEATKYHALFTEYSDKYRAKYAG